MAFLQASLTDPVRKVELQILELQEASEDLATLEGLVTLEGQATSEDLVKLKVLVDLVDLQK